MLMPAMGMRGQTSARHIDELPCLSDGPESSFNYSSGTAYEGHHRTIGGFARVYIQQANACYCFDLAGDLPDDITILSFAEIWYAFDDLIRHRVAI
jgi:hypothetical protein